MDHIDNHAKKSVKVRNRVALATTIAITAVMLLLAIRSYLPSSKLTPAVTTITVQAAKATVASHRPSFKLLGKVRSVNQSLLSSPVADVVTAILVREGEPVQKGQVLALIDSRQTSLQLLQQQNLSEKLRAELQDLELSHQRNEQHLIRLKKSLQLSNKNVERQSTLLSSNAASSFQHEQEIQKVLAAQMQVYDLEYLTKSHPQKRASLMNDLNASEAKATQLALDIERLSLKAPFNGVVEQRFVAPGERVNPNQSIISLYDIDTLEVVANIPNRYQQAITDALANKQVITGQVVNSDITLSLSYVGQIIGDGELAQKGYFTINDGTPLMHNSVLLVDVILPPQLALAIPETSLYPDNTVYTIEHGSLVAHHVEVLGHNAPQSQQRQLLLHPQQDMQDKLILTQYVASAKSGLAVLVMPASMGGQPDNGSPPARG